MQGHVRPAKRKDGTIIKGVYDVVYDVGIDPVTGRRKQKWKRIHGWKEAHQYLRERIKELEQGTYILNDKITFGEFALKWLGDHAQHKRNSTRESYEMIVRNHLVPALGHLRLRQINAEAIQDYYRAKLESGRLDREGKPTGEPLSPTTVNTHHRILRKIMSAALKAHLIHRNPTDDVDPPPKAKPKHGFLTSAQARRLLDVARERKSRYYPLYLAALTTGMRQGELLGWRWEDIDFTRQTARVIQTLEKPGRKPVFGVTKSNAGRSIVLVQPLVEALLEWREVQEEEARLIGPSYPNWGLVFTSPTGNPADASTIIRRDYKPILEAAGLPNIRFHDLRHSTASILLEMGVHPKIVAEMLGHSRIDVTMDTYSHATPTLQRSAAEKLEEALFGPKRGEGAASIRRRGHRPSVRRQPWFDSRKH